MNSVRRMVRFPYKGKRLKRNVGESPRAQGTVKSPGENKSGTRRLIDCDALLPAPGAE